MEAFPQQLGIASDAAAALGEINIGRARNRNVPARKGAEVRARVVLISWVKPMGRH